MAELSVKGLTKHFGGIAALNRVDLTVASGARHAIIGPNGAGKSTLFNLVAGELPPTEGQVYLGERNVTALPVYERANLGLGHTFQRNNLFMELSVFANVRLAVQHRLGINRHWFRPIGSFKQLEERTDEILRRVGLLGQRDRPVSALAYGQRRALEVGLALASEPRVLLLDEPTAGMSPAETTEMTGLIESLPESLTILIIEHDMDVIFNLAERITVLHYGQIISEGTPEQIRADQTVQEIYLGSEGLALSDGDGGEPGRG
ncbi:MAG: ABC transporter ATP-binding protein [Candidatus Promineifilaceae bacterium]|nr:ABC transporter ATP-binding protein [Candidatus Promineifilaceae bacterium]